MKEVVGRRQGTRDGVARVRVADFSLTAHGASLGGRGIGFPGGPRGKYVCYYVGYVRS